MALRLDIHYRARENKKLTVYCRDPRRYGLQLRPDLADDIDSIFKGVRGSPPVAYVEHTYGRSDSDTTPLKLTTGYYGKVELRVAATFRWAKRTERDYNDHKYSYIGIRRILPNMLTAKDMASIASHIMNQVMTLDKIPPTKFGKNFTELSSNIAAWARKDLGIKNFVLHSDTSGYETTYDNTVVVDNIQINFRRQSAQKRTCQCGKAFKAISAYLKHRHKCAGRPPNEVVDISTLNKIMPSEELYVILDEAGLIKWEPVVYAPCIDQTLHDIIKNTKVLYTDAADNSQVVKAAIDAHLDALGELNDRDPEADPK